MLPLYVLLSIGGPDLLLLRFVVVDSGSENSRSEGFSRFLLLLTSIEKYFGHRRPDLPRYSAVQ